MITPGIAANTAASLLEKARSQTQSDALNDIWISPAAQAAESELETICTDMRYLENDLRQFSQNLESIR